MTRTHWRLVVCVVLGCIAGDFARAQLAFRPVHPDIGQVWFAARAVLHGQNPYALIGPGRAFEWEAPLFYPLPAALVALPLAPFGEGTAVFLFAGIGIAVFTWAVTRESWSGLWAVTSLCVLHAALIAQWSPLIAGAYVLAPLGMLFVAKPTVGLAVFAAKPSWWAIGAGAVLIPLAFLLQPHWFTAWRDALASASVGTGARFPYLTPVTLPGGPLILVALTRWRRPEARLLVALACIPHTTLPYEAVYLFLIPRGWREMVTLSALSWGATGFVRMVLLPTNLTTGVIAYGYALTIFLYVPCALLMLRRPNEGAVPAWLEQRIARWPSWLSGRAIETEAGSLADRRESPAR